MKTNITSYAISLLLVAGVSCSQKTNTKDPLPNTNPVIIPTPIKIIRLFANNS